MVGVIVFTFLLDQKGKKKSRQNDASAHRPLRRPAVLPGLAFLIFVILSLSKDLLGCSFPSRFGGVPEWRGGEGHPPLSICIGAVRDCTATVRRFIGAGRNYTVAVTSFIGAVRDCTATVTRFIGAVRHCTAG